MALWVTPEPEGGGSLWERFLRVSFETAPKDPSGLAVSTAAPRIPSHDGVRLGVPMNTRGRAVLTCWRAPTAGAVIRAARSGMEACSTSAVVSVGLLATLVAGLAGGAGGSAPCPCRAPRGELSDARRQALLMGATNPAPAPSFLARISTPGLEPVSFASSKRSFRRLLGPRPLRADQRPSPRRVREEDEASWAHPVGEVGLSCVPKRLRCSAPARAKMWIRSTAASPHRSARTHIQA